MEGFEFRRAGGYPQFLQFAPGGNKRFHGLLEFASRTALAERETLCIDRAMQERFDEAAILAIERPHVSLWKYYLLCCVAIPPLFPFLVLPAWFRFHTMRYRFADDGISMSWGILFRREVIIQYARIQDIHIRSNVFERWLGLARVLVQTASGNSSSEMTLEGLRQFNDVRDFLYSKMRGVKGRAAGVSENVSSTSASDTADLAATMREVAGELRMIRKVIESGAAGPAKGAND